MQLGNITSAKPRDVITANTNYYFFAHACKKGTSEEDRSCNEAGRLAASEEKRTALGSDSCSSWQRELSYLCARFNFRPEDRSGDRAAAATSVRLSENDF